MAASTTTGWRAAREATVSRRPSDMMSSSAARAAHLIDFGSLNTGITADLTTGLATYANALGSAAFSSITSLFGGKAADSFGGNALLNRLFGFGGTMR